MNPLEDLGGKFIVVKEVEISVVAPNIFQGNGDVGIERSGARSA